MERAPDHPRGAGLSRRNFFATAGGVVGSTLVLSACGGSGGGPGSSVLNYGESGSFTTLNPWEQAYGGRSLANQVFSRLVYLDQRGKPVPDLAASWVLAEDGKSLVLKLRPGLTWQDGENVLAHDFVRMFGYLSDPALQSSVGVQKMKQSFLPVAAVTAPDPSTVIMKFSAPVPYYLDILDYWYLLRFDDPSDPEFLTHPPIGTGPFRLTSIVPAQRASLQAFPGYYAKMEPKLKAVNFNVFGATSNLVSDLRSALVDGVEVSDYAQLESIKGDNSFAVTAQPIGVWLMQVNVSKPPFNNVSVRQALSYSLDRVQMANVAFEGFEESVSTPFYSSTATGFVASLVNAQSFDLAKAKSLLDSAGVKNLTINYPTPTSIPTIQTVGEIWQYDLAKIGVNLQIQPVTQALWTQLGAANLHPETIDVVPWNSGRSLQDAAGFWATQLNFRGGTEASLNRFGYHNAHLEELVAQGAIETDATIRRQIYQQLNQIVVRDAYQISFATFSRIMAWSTKVKGPTSDLPGNLELAYAEIS